MAHFAELDENGIVRRVIVVGNGNIVDQNGNESEALGVAYIKEILPESGPWIQTSYNHNFRIRYAGIGMKYYEEYDGFGWPEPPTEFPSWVLNTTTLEWEPPIPMPNVSPQENHYWSWDEPTVSWVELPFPEINDQPQS